MERGLKSISDPNLIAKHICTANTRQYVQAHPTPIGSGGLAQQIGSLANTPVALALLQRQPPATQGYALSKGYGTKSVPPSASHSSANLFLHNTRSVCIYLQGGKGMHLLFHLWPTCRSL
jgi:hypothetical protein